MNPETETPSRAELLAENKHQRELILILACVATAFGVLLAIVVAISIK